MELDREVRSWNEENPPPKLLQGVKLLLAEDYLDIRLLLGLRLKWLGAKVDVASSGREVLEKALHREYDVILMDIKMPDMNGFEALEALRARKYKKPIIAVTAFGINEERELLLKSSFDGYVIKPFDEKDLIRLIRKAWEKSTSLV